MCKRVVRNFHAVLSQEMVKIRTECFEPARGWERPNGEEVRELLRQVSEVNHFEKPITANQIAVVLGLGKGADRTVRRWLSGDSPIPYAAWAILCELAGKGLIWKKGGVDFSR